MYVASAKNIQKLRKLILGRNGPKKSRLRNHGRRDSKMKNNLSDIFYSGKTALL